MSRVQRYEHLKNRPKSDQALPLLEKIASQVKPIMIKRDWKVGTLGEFFPSDPSLLGINMNAGQRINLRLRPPGSPGTFYEYDQLVLVMLHELTHIQHGPHDASFYKLLSELEEEYYDLKRKGYSGEGFHSSGHTLPAPILDEYAGRKQGLLAAQKRLDVQRKIGKGGVLGGKGVGGRGMKEVLAEAAERRLRDDKTCHTGHGDVEAEVKKAENESEGVDAIDLPPTQRGGAREEIVHLPGPSKSVPSVSPPNLTPQRSIPPVRPQPQKSNPPPSTSKPNRPVPKQQIIDLTSDDDDQVISTIIVKPSTIATSEPQEWSCPTCTLLNPISARTCEACTSPSPLPVTPKTSKDVAGRKTTKEEAGWYCDFCGFGPRDMGYWSCQECGWVRKWG